MQLGNQDLEWKGHAGFLIQSNSKLIYIDPYKLPAGSGNNKADIILITHSHYDHCSIEDLGRIVKDGCVVICPADCQSKLTKLSKKIKIQVIEPGQEQDINGFKVKALPAYNQGKEFHSKDEQWNSYILEFPDSKRIYHAGDTDLIPEMQELANSNIDLALLPVGGTYTMNADEAARAAFIIKPKKAVPMHFGDVVGSREDAERFVELCKREGIEAEMLEAS
jgi:L-ascorbate metabolism protein UlaG (beta-lactamase superfamily)